VIWFYDDNGTLSEFLGQALDADKRNR